MTDTRPVVCCACHQQCGLLVHVDGGRVTQISGDREHPFSAGFICPKGKHAHELHYHPARVHEPLKRAGARGAGQWQTISWQQALDEIAGSIHSLTERHGRESLAYAFGTFHGADWGIGQRFMNLFGSPNTVGQDKICYGPGALGEALTCGFGPSFFTFPIPGKTRCMVVWGLRPSASMPLLWRQILMAQRAGAKLVVIDPERTREVHTADLWLQNIPGTDVALMLSLIHCVIDAGRHDAAFVEANTVGFSALRKRVAEYPPEVAEKLTRVPAAQIRQLAQMLTDHSPAIIHAGNGLYQSGKTSVQCGRALACLVAITGNLGVEGGHMHAGPPRDLVSNGDAFGSAALSDEQRGKRLGADRFAILGPGYSRFDAAMSRAWHGQSDVMNWLTTAHEPTLWRAITEEEPYPVKALILQHHNPVGASANAKLAAAALTSPGLELSVVQDLFLTATSSLADYVLPAAHWLEKPFYSMGLGYIGFAGDFVEAKPAALTPEFGHRGDYDLWRDLGRRLGQAEQWPDTAEEFWNGCLVPAGLDFSTVSASKGPLMGKAAQNPDREDAAQKRPAYGTPSGKIELSSSLLAEWGHDPLPAFELPPMVSANAAAYPLTLTTGGRKIEGFHQDAQLMPWFRRKYPEPQVSMHPETAAQAGIADGDWAWIETPIGRVRQRARLTDDLLPQTVHADRWWYPERGADRDDPFGWRSSNINVCTDDAVDSCDPILGTWLLRGVPCRIVADTAG